MGAVFSGNATTAPAITLSDGTRLNITIDHIIERQTSPDRALDPANLRLSTRRENTVVLRQLHAQDPFVSPPDDWVPLEQVRDNIKSVLAEIDIDKILSDIDRAKDTVAAAAARAASPMLVNSIQKYLNDLAHGLTDLQKQHYELMLKIEEERNKASHKWKR
jgi:hypothetical protein